LEKEESIRMDSKNAMRRCRKQIAHIEKNWLVGMRETKVILNQILDQL
jgi:hypothetical protein